MDVRFTGKRGRQRSRGHRGKRKRGGKKRTPAQAARVKNFRRARRYGGEKEDTIPK